MEPGTPVTADTRNARRRQPPPEQQHQQAPPATATRAGESAMRAARCNTSANPSAKTRLPSAPTAQSVERGPPMKQRRDEIGAEDSSEGIEAAVQLDDQRRPGVGGQLADQQAQCLRLSPRGTGPFGNPAMSAKATGARCRRYPDTSICGNLYASRKPRGHNDERQYHGANREASRTSAGNRIAGAPR